MKKILVIGSGGSGKSTFSRKLGEATQLPVYHLDTFYWKPGWVPTPNEEWGHLQKELIKKEKWIIDGNYGRTLDIRISEADTIVFLDLSRWITTYRVIKRRVMYHGRTRPDLAEGCPESLDFEFIKLVWNFKRDKRPAIIEKLKKLSKNKEVIILRKTSDVNLLMDKIKNNIRVDSNFLED